MTITQSSIQLHDMHFYAYHGVMEQEQRVGGEYLVSLDVDVDLSRPAISDSISDTVNYAELYRVVAVEMGRASLLLEHVAGRIAQGVLDDFPQVKSLRICITKCNPPIGADCRGASVEIHALR